MKQLSRNTCTRQNRRKITLGQQTFRNTNLDKLHLLINFIRLLKLLGRCCCFELINKLTRGVVPYESLSAILWRSVGQWSNRAPQDGLQTYSYYNTAC